MFKGYVVRKIGTDYAVIDLNNSQIIQTYSKNPSAVKRAIRLNENEKKEKKIMTRNEMSMSYKTSPEYSPGDFVLEDVDKTFLKQNGIQMTIAEFKTIVRKTPPFRTTISGNVFIFTHTTNVWNVRQFKEK